MCSVCYVLPPSVCCLNFLVCLMRFSGKGNPGQRRTQIFGKICRAFIKIKSSNLFCPPLRHVTISCDFGRSLRRWQQLVVERDPPSPARSAAVTFSAAAAAATSPTSSEWFVRSTQQTGRKSKLKQSFICFYFCWVRCRYNGINVVSFWERTCRPIIFGPRKYWGRSSWPSGQHECATQVD